MSSRREIPFFSLRNPVIAKRGFGAYADESSVDPLDALLQREAASKQREELARLTESLDALPPEKRAIIIRAFQIGKSQAMDKPIDQEEVERILADLRRRIRRN